MAYSKPQVIAANNAQGSYVAGCPSENMGNAANGCRACYRAE